MKRIIVEHSEPGYVIGLSDSLEFTLRHLSWERAGDLARELLEFAKGFPGGEALAAFHLETPGEAGRIPPCLATLADVDESAVKAVVAAARERLGLPFEFYMSVLLEGREWTRKDYVEDLEMELRLAEEAKNYSLPAPLARHRARLLEEEFRRAYPAPKDIIVANAVGSPRLGWRWVQEEAESWEKVLEWVDEAVSDVGRYLLLEQDPEAVPAEDLPGWCLVALQVDRSVLPRYFEVLERRAEYLWQKFCFAYGFGQLISDRYLEEKMRGYLDEARRQYTAEAAEAMERLFREVRKRLAPLKEDVESVEEDGDEGGLD